MHITLFYCSKNQIEFYNKTYCLMKEIKINIIALSLLPYKIDYYKIILKIIALTAFHYTQILVN